MKRMKKLASLLLAMVMVLSMTVAAFAEGEADKVTAKKDEEKFTITLTHEKAGHTYIARQVFQGDLLVENPGTNNEKKILSNIEWAAGIDGAALIEKLKGNTELASAFNDAETAHQVAEALAGKGDDSAFMQAFAKVVGDYLKDVTVYSKQSTEVNGEYKIESLKPGYYVVEDITDKDSVTEGDAYTRYIMQVVADVTAAVKVFIPDIDKKIVVNDQKVDTNTAAIGQTVYFEITGLVPDRTGYDKYYYIINDTLSKGLTLNADSLTVTLGEGTEQLTLTKGDPSAPQLTDDYYVYISNGEDKKTTLEIAFADILDTKYVKDAKITVNYSAVVNSDAEVGTATGNLNTANLKYSNNPNFKYDGTEDEENPGKPKTDVPTGVSPDKKTLTYVAQIDITKYANDENHTLEGAGFTLKGISMQLGTQLKDVFEEDADGTYYKLKDGTYTTKIPHGDITDDEGNVVTKSNMDSYENPDKKYTLKTELTTADQYLEEITMADVKSDKDGKLTFKGLGAGVYVIEETIVPDGYNKAPNIVIEIKCNFPETFGDPVEWKIGTATSEHIENNGEVKADATVVGATGVYSASIINMSGAQLPSTGGIGRTIFYAAGIILMAGAMFFVVRRKRA